METTYELKAEQACSFLRAHPEEPFIRHEWDELLEKLTDSADPELHVIGLRERNAARTGSSSHS